MSDIIDKLERLQKLRAEGALSEAEFAAEKARLLGAADGNAGPTPVPNSTSFEPLLPSETASELPWWIWLAGGATAVGVVAGLLFLLLPPTRPVGLPGPTPKPSASASPADPLAALPPNARLDLAETAAFPDGRRFTTPEGSRIEYEPGMLIDTPFGPVLVSQGGVPDAAHVESGHVGIFYLAPQGRGYRVVKSLPDAIQSGSFGQMSALSVSTKFATLPMVFAQGGGTWQGYTCSWTSLTELQPGGPVEVANFLDSYSNGGGGASGEDKPQETTGTIVNIVKDTSFDVRFTGSRSFTAHYIRQSGKFVLQGGEANALQGC